MMEWLLPFGIILMLAGVFVGIYVYFDHRVKQLDEEIKTLLLEIEDGEVL